MSSSTSEWLWEDAPNIRKPFPEKDKDVKTLVSTLKLPQRILNVFDIQELRTAAEKRIQEEVSPPLLILHLLLS